MSHHDRINNIYKYHPPQGNQAERYEQLRERAKSLALLIEELCPDSR